jgi:hypothetical protein
MSVTRLEDRTVPSFVSIVPYDPTDWPIDNHDTAGALRNTAETRLSPAAVVGAPIAQVVTGGQSNGFAAPSRPFSAHGSGAFTNAAGGFLATGTATHLGAFTHYGTLVLTQTNDPTIFTISVRVTYEAANGDKLFADLYATLNAQTGAANGTDTWAGGTGRFAQASGTANVTAQLFPDGSFTFDIKGNIKY